MDNVIFFISVFLAGILSFFSPCILPLLPVYAGVLLDDKNDAQASSGKFSISLVSLLRTLAFIAGISFIFILLGYGAGFLGNLLYASWFQYVTGAIIILLGLHQMEVLHLQGLYKERRLQLKRQGQKGNGYSQAFLLGRHVWGQFWALFWPWRLQVVQELCRVLVSCWFTRWVWRYHFWF